MTPRFYFPYFGDTRRFAPLLKQMFDRWFAAGCDDCANCFALIDWDTPAPLYPFVRVDTRPYRAFMRRDEVTGAAFDRKGAMVMALMDTVQPQPCVFLDLDHIIRRNCVPAFDSYGDGVFGAARNGQPEFVEHPDFVDKTEEICGGCFLLPSDSREIMAAYRHFFSTLTDQKSVLLEQRAWTLAHRDCGGFVLPLELSWGMYWQTSGQQPKGEIIMEHHAGIEKWTAENALLGPVDYPKIQLPPEPAGQLQKCCVVVMCHREAEEVFYRNAKYWRHHGLPMVLTFPEKQAFPKPDWPEIVSVIEKGPKSHMWALSMRRYKLMLLELLRLPFSHYLLCEYDSFCLEKDFSKLLGDDALHCTELHSCLTELEEYPGAPTYHHTPMIFSRNFLRRFLEKAVTMPNYVDRGYFDRYLARICKSEGLPVAPYGRYGWSCGGTIENKPEHVSMTKWAVSTGAKMIHGVKTAECLALVEEAAARCV